MTDHCLEESRGLSGGTPQGLPACPPPSAECLERSRGGRPGLDIAAPLCLEDGTGRPTAELDNAYFRTKETNA